MVSPGKFNSHSRTNSYGNSFHNWKNHCPIQAVEDPYFTKGQKSSNVQLKTMLSFVMVSPPPNIHGIAQLHRVPEGQKISQYYYIHVLAERREIRNKNCTYCSWILHQDNAPAHSTVSVKRFLAKYSTPVLDHP